MKNALQNLKIYRLSVSDTAKFSELIAVFVDVFTEKQRTASTEHLSNVLSNPHFHVFIAEQENKVIGGLTIHELVQYHAEQSEFYIYDFAVATNFHRQGIGTQIISEARKFANEKNVSAIFVDAHAEDKEAIHFYRSTFGKGVSVKHFTIEL